MRRQILLPLAAVVIAAAPQSERPTGSNIPGAKTSTPVQQSGNIAPDWNDADAVSQREARRMARRFAQCVVKRHPNPAMLVATTDISNLEIVRKYSMLQDTDCAFQADRSNSSFRLSLSGNGLRYALAEALVNAQFPEPWPAISTAPAIMHRVYDPARFIPPPGNKYTAAQLKMIEEVKSLDQGLAFAEVFGECVARADPLNAHLLLTTLPVSPEEDAAVQALYLRLPGCVPAGQKVTINVDIVRGAVALSYYRLAKALQGAVADATHR
jgi:hypothetical protein